MVETAEVAAARKIYVRVLHTKNWISSTLKPQIPCAA